MSKELAPTEQQTTGVATAQSFEHMQRVAKMLSTSDIIPESYRGKIANCMIACMTANDMGKSPIFVMNNADIIYNKLAWKSTYIASAIKASGEFSGLRYKYNEDNTACTAYAKDLTTGEIVEGTTVTMEMAKAEGWTTRKGNKWGVMSQQMLAYRAATFFGRLYTPGLLNGMQTSDEVVDIESYKSASDEVQELNDQLQNAAGEDVPQETLKHETIEDAEVIEDGDDDLID